MPPYRGAARIVCGDISIDNIIATAANAFLVVAAKEAGYGLRLMVSICMNTV